MNTKKKTTLLLLCIPLLITAQQQGTNSDDNRSDAEREPSKQKTAWIHPGNGGSSQLWDFNRTFTVNDEKSDVESRYRDEWLTGREKETQHHYFLSGDSLICTGYENEMTTVEYSQSQVLLRFPINYGQSSQADFKGRGEFGKGGDKSEEALQLTLTGNIMTMTDGWGCLILPGGETLKDVFRVHIVIRSLRQADPLTPDFDIHAPVDEKTDMREGDNTSWIVEDVYRWYVAESRCPVFETQETRIVSGEDPAVMQRSAATFHAGDQKQFQTFGNENQLFRTQSRDLLNTERKFSHHIYPNPANDRLHIIINPTEQLTIAIGLYDMQGRLLRQLPIKEISGEYTETINTSGLAKGSYVLRIQTGNDTVNEVIVKQ